MTHYRYADYITYSEGGRVSSTLSLLTYEEVSTTDKGVWVRRRLWPKKHFILTKARKKYAYPTKELAWESFVARKHWRVAHLERQLKEAKVSLQLRQDLASVSL